jgi:crotonobetainyl-CoA:carnitine CoA-transferase CaiB-like acyl-CoA transferase
LSGIRVLDFTAFPPGGACTVLLADLGAEVIRVDAPAQKGKPSLVIGQVGLSRAKRSISLDMRNPTSSKVLQRLASVIDVVVEASKPGSMEQRGFGYSHAKAVNRGMIWCAMTGFGQSGPYANHGGHDLSYLAHSGLLGALSAEQPWHPALSLALQAGALCAVVAIQAALIERVRSGQGSFIDSSLSEAAGWLLTCGINPFSERPLMIPATPDRRLYACADGRYVAVASAEPRTWGALCDALGLPELETHLNKPEHFDADTKALAEIFNTRPSGEWMERLVTAGATVTVVNHAAQVLEDPHIRARGSVVEAAGVPVPANPVRLTTPDGRQTGTTTAAPHRVGEDTAVVLSGAGFSDSEIAALEKDGVI